MRLFDVLVTSHCVAGIYLGRMRRIFTQMLRQERHAAVCFLTLDHDMVLRLSTSRGTRSLISFANGQSKFASMSTLSQRTLRPCEIAGCLDQVALPGHDLWLTFVRV